MAAIMGMPGTAIQRSGLLGSRVQTCPGGARPLGFQGRSSNAAQAAVTRRSLLRARQRHLVTQAIFSATTSNPGFTYGRLDSAIVETDPYRDQKAMTVGGTLNKAGLLLVMSVATAAATWAQILSGNAAAIMGALAAAKAAGLVGMGAVLVSMLKPQWSPFTAPTYALCKGVALAGLSAMLEARYPGIGMNAVLLTMSTAGSCFFALKTGLIKLTDRFVDTVRAVTGGYFVALMLTFIMGMCGVRIPGLFSAGPLAAGLGLISAGLAAANLLLDMDFIERASDQRLPVWMEWYSAQSLMLTLVWMYTELLRVLMAFMGMGGDRD